MPGEGGRGETTSGRDDVLTTCKAVSLRGGQQTFLRSRTPTGSSSHSRQCEYTAHVVTSVKIECEILVLEISLLGKNYLVISNIVVKLLAKNQGKFFCYSFGVFRDVNIR